MARASVTGETRRQHYKNVEFPTTKRPFFIFRAVALSRRCAHVVPAGYGMVFVPSSPGSYDLDCVTWRPQGSLVDRFSGENCYLELPTGRCRVAL